MEKMKLLAIPWGIALVYLLSACAAMNAESRLNNDLEKDFSVLSTGFHTTSPKTCRPSDLDLDNNRIEQFFQVAKTTSLEDLNANHEFAPCHLSGELLHNKSLCLWKIQASAIGEMACEGDVIYFACERESCKQLFSSD